LGASALSGRAAKNLLLPFQGVLPKTCFCPFRACCQKLASALCVPPDLKSAAKEGVPPDLKSGVKKCPNLFRLCGFEIRSKGVCFSFCWGITNPPGLIGRTFFDGGLQIRRDAKIFIKYAL
ncbi:MAG: hypothetical protein ACOCM9_08990, partial [Segatella copri]